MIWSRVDQGGIPLFLYSTSILKVSNLGLGDAYILADSTLGFNDEFFRTLKGEVHLCFFKSILTSYL